MDKDIIIPPDARLAPVGEAMPLRQGSRYWNRSSSGCLCPTAATSFFCGPSEAHTPSHIYVPPYLGGLRYGGLGFLRESVARSLCRSVGFAIMSALNISICNAKKLIQLSQAVSSRRAAECR